MVREGDVMVMYLNLLLLWVAVYFVVMFIVYCCWSLLYVPTIHGTRIQLVIIVIDSAPPGWRAVELTYREELKLSHECCS